MDVIQYGGLLNKAFCDLIITAAQDNMRAAGVVGEQDGSRIADDAWIDPKSSPEIEGLREWIAGTTSSPIENQEDGTVVRYKSGGKYELHHDFFRPEIPIQAEELLRGGNRVWSFLVYLNEDFKGGETYFPNHNLKVKPEIGKGVLWRNTEDGVLLEESQHAGEPVIEGEKWVYITWIRENEFRYETENT